MTPDQIARFRQIIAEHLGVNLAKVTDDARFVDDLGADSLDVFEIAMAAEEEFDIDVDHDVDGMATVGAALACLGEKLS